MRFLSSAIVVVSLLAVALPPIAAADPISKGSRMIGGTFSFSSSGGDLYEINNKRVTRLQMNPSLNVFVFDRFSLGGVLAIDRTSSDAATSMGFGIGPRIAYFFGQTGSTGVPGSVYPYIGFAILYTRQTYDPSGIASDLTISGYSFGFGCGLISMLSNEIGLSFELTYQIDSATVEYGGFEDSESGDSVNLTAGIACFLY